MQQEGNHASGSQVMCERVTLVLKALKSFLVFNLIFIFVLSHYIDISVEQQCSPLV